MCNGGIGEESIDGELDRYLNSDICSDGTAEQGNEMGNDCTNKNLIENSKILGSSGFSIFVLILAFVLV